MRELKYLNKYFIKYKKHLLLGVLFITLTVCFQIVGPQMVRRSLDLITSYLDQADKESLSAGQKATFGFRLLQYAGILLVAALLRGLFLYATRQTVIIMSRRIEYDLKNEVYQHYQSLPLSFYRKNKTGDLMARISEDVSKVRMYLGPAIMYGINLIVLFTITVGYMYSVNKLLTFFVLLPLPILSVSIYYVSDRMNIQSERIQRSLSNLSTFVQEAFSGIRVLKSFVREEESSLHFSQESKQYKKESLKLVAINSWFFPLILGMIGASTVLAVYIGGKEAMKGNVSVGNIAEFIIYVNMLTWPVTSLGWVTSIIQRAAASQQRINEFLSQKTDVVSNANVNSPIEGAITFDKVSFTYPSSGIEAVKEVSFELKKGEKLALIGGTGSGKSTIANLICRLYNPTNGGDIKVDAQDIEAYGLQYLRSHIGYVPQDVFLFSDTIQNNVAFADETVSMDVISQATKDAYVHHNIMDFPDGFQTLVGERGITLSGGQKQRISIARALVKNPKILILDDCLSAVDTKTEDIILKNLQTVMRDKTALIISHRVSSVKFADRILVLDDGRIVQSGTHDELLSHDGLYKQFCEQQLHSEGIK